MNIVARTAVFAMALAGLAPAASATAQRAPVMASAAAGCSAAGWRNAATIVVHQNPMGVAVDTRTDTIYAAGWGSHSVSVINGQTNTVTATIRVGKVGSIPFGIWADQLTNRIYVAAGGGVSVINGRTNTVIHRIATGSSPFWLALDSRTSTLYVTNEASLSIDAINLKTDTVAAKIQLRFAPYGIAMDPATDTAYAVVAGQGLFAIDGRTNTVTAKIPVGDAFGVAVDAVTGQAFVANPHQNTVTVVNTRDHAVAGSVPVGRQPLIGLAADPHRGIVYATSEYGDSVAVLVRCQPPGR